MTPLFYAVYHGCQAGRYEETVDRIYRQRIQRGEEFYTTRRLGAYGMRLSLLANFFCFPWTEPVPGLSSGAQSWIIYEAGFSLRAVGRLSEALKPSESPLSGSWKSSAGGTPLRVTAMWQLSPLRSGI